MRVREWIYQRARAGEEFTVLEMADALELTPDQARSLPSIMHSAVISGILVKGGEKSVARTITPEEWTQGTKQRKARISQLYKGNPRIVKASNGAQS